MLAVKRAHNLSVVMPRPIPWNRWVSVNRIEIRMAKELAEPTHGTLMFLPGLFLFCPMTTLGSPDSICLLGFPARRPADQPGRL
jgi:hypothetical protein